MGQKRGHLPPLWMKKIAKHFLPKKAKIKAPDRRAPFPAPPPGGVRGALTTPPPLGAIFHPPCEKGLVPYGSSGDGAGRRQDCALTLYRDGESPWAPPPVPLPCAPHPNQAAGARHWASTRPPRPWPSRLRQALGHEGDGVVYDCQKVRDLRLEVRDLRPGQPHCRRGVVLSHGIAVGEPEQFHDDVVELRGCSGPCRHTDGGAKACDWRWARGTQSMALDQN